MTDIWALTNLEGYQLWKLFEKINFQGREKLFLAATKQLYEWFAASVCLSVCLFVRRLRCALRQQYIGCMRAELGAPALQPTSVLTKLFCLYS